MSTYFDETYYLKTKLAQLKAVGETDANGNPYTMETMLEAFAAAGVTPQQHYERYGRNEGLNPNPYFNEAEYLQAKLAQLHSNDERDSNGNPFTLETLKEAIAGIGMTPAEHYEFFGSHETNKDGTLINPSNAFDANAYMAAKLYQLQTTGTPEEQAEWADKTPADVVDAIQKEGMSAVSHYQLFGADEANSGNVPLVQTVPSEQRVANDPMRDNLNQNVPSNYNDPTPPPSEAVAAPVTKPADMGGLASTAVSPQVVAPDHPVAVPGDEAYVAPPAGTVDTNDKPVVPTVDPDSGQLVVPTTPEPTPTPDPDPTPSDTTPPPAPTFADNIAEDNVIDMGEAHKNVFLTGTAEAYSTVKITVTDDAQQSHSITLKSGTADAKGAFSIALTPTEIAELTDGTLTLSVTATDAAGNVSKATTKTITFDADADKTINYSDNSFGYATPQALENAQLGDPYDATSNGILSELRKVWNEGVDKKNGKFKDITTDFIANNAPSVDKLVHFSEDGKIASIESQAPDGNGYLNLSADTVYGGGLALKLNDLNSVIHDKMTDFNGQSQATVAAEALFDVLGKAYFDVPEIDATAKNVVNLEVNKVGSIHKGALTADMLNHDLTFSSLVQLVSEMKPVAVDAHAARLDIHLADGGDADIVNMMEVRGDVTDITFSGTKGLFGLNIDARGADGTATSGTVENIDASSLTDPNSGVYVNTAPIGISMDLGDGEKISKGINATVAEKLTFTGSEGDDILVMTQGKYTEATLDGRGGDNDTLAILVTSNTFDKPINIGGSEIQNFENAAFVSLVIGLGDEGNNIYQSFSADASTFKDVKNFITSNDLALTNYGGQTVTVVGGLDDDVQINLTAQTEQAATINLAMTSNFLSTILNGLVEGKATLTGLTNISSLTLKGADAAADILLTNTALQALDKKTIDVTEYAGTILFEEGWSYAVNENDSTTGTLTNNTYSINLSGIHTETSVLACYA